MRSLLDVNVLLALFDEDHVHHDRARDWLVAHASDGWASCPLTENGFVRILSQPAYPGSVSVATALGMLAGARRDPSHEFWPADLSLVDQVEASLVHGHRQVTDLYLTALAASRGGRFVTFDARIPLSAVPAASADSLLVLGS